MKKNGTIHFTTGIFMVIFLLAFVIIAGRFVYIQTVKEVAGVDLAKWAKEKRTSSYPLYAERGKIFDNNGMTLAYDRPTFRVYAILDPIYSENSEVPKHVKNPQKTAELLAPILNMKKNDVKKILENGIEKKRFQVEFGISGKELSQQKKDEIAALHIPGIYFEKEAIRFYPNGMFASHIIGFARKHEDGSLSGVTGMEDQMNRLLGGKDGYITYLRDKYNKKLLDPNEVVRKAQDGKNVYLTIDQKIQTLLEDVLSQVAEEYDPERTTAVVMNPKTGEILAMSNRPSYNPNNPEAVENWYNDAISTPFEPGSTMKMFTWAAAIEENVYKGDELYQSGSYRLNERTRPVDDHNGGRGWGPITYDEGFQRSSNVAAAKLVWEKLGTEKYLEYLKRFRFDQKTGIDLPGEVAGQILYNWPLEKLTSSFGQGSTVTPIQQMMAATAIANDGKMVQPFVIKKIVDPTTKKIVEEKKPTVVGEPISKDTADQVMDLLETVVSAENGTGHAYKLDDYSVAGKTGTAQIPKAGSGGYLTGNDNYIFSFLGMAPKDDPQLMMYVSVKQPKLKAGKIGSDPVSFIFNNVMENSLHYLNIDPDKEANEQIETVKIPKLVGEDTKVLENELKNNGLTVTVLGKGKKIIATNVKEGSELLAVDRVILVTDQPEMPNIIGWSLRDVYKLSDLMDLKLETIGNGYVVTQNIKVGKPLKKDDYLGVELSDPKQQQAELEKKPEQKKPATLEVEPEQKKPATPEVEPEQKKPVDPEVEPEQENPVDPEAEPEQESAADAQARERAGG